MTEQDKDIQQLRALVRSLQETLEVQKKIISEDDETIHGYKVLIKDLRARLNKHRKYAWHDLTKNPKDLPKSKGAVLVAKKFMTQKGFFYSISFYDTKFRSELDDNHRRHKAFYFYDSEFGDVEETDLVVAWKYIEGFEE